jgi:serine/threonine protein kinase
MAMASGTRVGPYEITAQIGAGGMGEVYRARDTRLNRDVALKILPEAFAADPDRVARFTREAQLLASLNHPNIAAIYGFEEQSDVASGFSRTVQALVLELVEGPTLAERIAGGRIPVDEALAIARQIADALEAAYEHGIVHRDLKPANIKVTPDGVVKVLDFGLAKLVEAGDRGVVHDRGVRLQPDLTASPTITTPGMATGIGVILGTAAYMAPEQAKGRPADKRADIWAFGCVLYEMLTGRAPFAGEDVSDTLANVLKREPDWAALPADTPPMIRAPLRRCLVKDRRTRASDVAAAIFAIDEAAHLAASTVAADSAERPPGWRRALALFVALVAGAALTSGVMYFRAAPAEAPELRLQVSRRRWTPRTVRSRSPSHLTGKASSFAGSSRRFLGCGFGGFRTRRRGHCRARNEARCLSGHPTAGPSDFSPINGSSGLTSLEGTFRTSLMQQRRTALRGAATM